jgi:beta-galactosidase/beta-glucuronidase
MDQHNYDTSLDSFLSFGYSKVFEQYQVSSDLLLPFEGRETEPLAGNWFFTRDSRNRWITDHPKAGIDNSLSSEFFTRWEQTPSWVNTGREGTALYAKEFEYHREKVDEKVFLRFGGMTCSAVVFLNSSCVACQKGDEKPFSVDITKLAKERNTLFVALNGAELQSENPYCKNAVALVRTIPVGVQNWSLSLDPRYDNQAISLDITLSSSCAKNIRMDIPELGIEETLRLSNGRVHAVIKATPELWTETNPKLYSVKLAWDDESLVEFVGFKSQ